MSGYTKLFSSILASTIWRAPHPTRIVWITMLAMTDRHGIVEASVPGLADFARVSLEDCQEALRTLQAPDPFSRSKAAEGRRIEAVEGGWRLINHGRYREKLNQDERREYLRVKQREWRAQQKNMKTKASTRVNKVSDKSTSSTHTDPTPTPTPDPNVQTPSVSESIPASHDAAPPRTASLDFVELWNTHTQPAIPRARDLTAKRRRQIAQRLRERPLTEWAAVFDRIQASGFCRGENDRGWRASFDWILSSADVAVKVLEGKYDNHAGRAPGRGGGWEDLL